MKMLRILAAATALCATIGLTPASAAGYPDHPVKVVVPFAAGGPTDVMARLIAQKMSEDLKQQFYVENRPGAGGNIGMAEVARAAPDGYTLLVAATNNFAINQFVLKMTFDPLKTLAPIAKVADVPLVLFSNPQVPARTLKAFIAYAKSNPGKVNYGIPSLGTVNHLLMERLKRAAGVDVPAVPYKGSPPALLALLKNEIQVFPIGLAAVHGYYREGKVTALAVATEKRIPMLPEVPTLIESGFPGFVASNWFGMAAPAGTPPQILDMLAAAVSEAQKTKLVTDRFATMGMLVPHETRQQFAASVKAEAAVWQETARRAHISIQ